MKKIINKSFYAALLRGAVFVFGSLCTMGATLFCNDIYQAMTVLCIGAGCICLINSYIK